jgi:hypothetical protein
MTWDRALAASVRFPVMIATHGSPGPGWLAGFQGAAADPEAVAVRYGAPWREAELEIWTYPGDPFEDLDDAVRTGFGDTWSNARHLPIPPPRSAGQHGSFTIVKTREDPEAEREHKREERAIRNAVKAAEHRHAPVSLDGVATPAYVISSPGVWAIGMRAKGVSAMLFGRGLDLAALELGLATDLPAHVGDPPID